jgi:superfamily II DNA or RNA helicase
MTIAVMRGGLIALYGVKQQEELRKSLVFQKYDYGTNTRIPIRCYTEISRPEGPVFLVPRHFCRHHPEFGPYEMREDFSLGEPLPEGICLSPKKSLSWRGINQDQVVTEMLMKAQTCLGGYGIAPCGSGKTLMGSELARRLGRATLIILSRRYQVTQWWAELEDSFVGMAGNVGIYQGKRRERSHPIILATINTLLKEPDPNFFKRFGTVFFDEGHHLPAATWMAMIARLRSKFIFALTASYHRTDKLDGLFQLLLGDTLAEAKIGTVSGGRVDMVHLPSYFSSRRPWGTHPNRKQWSVQLANNGLRNHALVEIISQVYEARRQALIFSDIREHLCVLKELCKKRIPEENMGSYMGGMADAALQEGGQKPVTFITYDMGSESVNLPFKDAAVCATPPPSNLKQLKGRIDRAHPTGGEKPAPYLVDFIDPGQYFERKGEFRVSQWKKEGLEVKRVSYTGDDNG